MDGTYEPNEGRVMSDAESAAHIGRLLGDGLSRKTDAAMLAGSTATHADHDARIATVSPTILLASGRYFDFTAPCALTVYEVAHALANICRFTGQVRTFYSVAQHSVLVSRLVPPHLAKWGLFHDAAEAVMGDMSTPLKRLLPEYKALEHRCEQPIFAGFGLYGAMPPEVKMADLRALRTEQRDLMPARGGVWTCLDGLDADGATIVPQTPDAAASAFMQRYFALCGAV